MSAYSKAAPIEKCFICGTNAHVNRNNITVLFVSCFRCGIYRIGSLASKTTPAFEPAQIANVSGWLREHPDYFIRQEDVAFLLSLPTPTVGDKATKLLVHISKQHATPGKNIDIALFTSSYQEGPPENGQQTLELVGVTWAENAQELGYLFSEYLCKETDFLEFTAKEYFQITPKGWAYLDSLRARNIESRLGFIAMWFSDTINTTWKAIDQGIQLAGYEARRIDQTHHNNKIDDEIIATIRRSRFVVADLTGHRPNVYYEGGFANGLGLKVIWTCRHKEHLEAHFDIRQYSIITWEDDRLTDLTKTLQNRIEATIGRGPLVSINNPW